MTRPDYGERILFATNQEGCERYAMGQLKHRYAVWSPVPLKILDGVAMADYLIDLEPGLTQILIKDGNSRHKRSERETDYNLLTSLAAKLPADVHGVSFIGRLPCSVSEVVLMPSASRLLAFSKVRFHQGVYTILEAPATNVINIMKMFGLRKYSVAGDGNCWIYAFLVGCGFTVDHISTGRRHPRRPSAKDLADAAELRRQVCDLLLHSPEWSGVADSLIDEDRHQLPNSPEWDSDDDEATEPVYPGGYGDQAHLRALVKLTGTAVVIVNKATLRVCTAKHVFIAPDDSAVPVVKLVTSAEVAKLLHSAEVAQQKIAVLEADQGALHYSVLTADLGATERYAGAARSARTAAAAAATTTTAAAAAAAAATATAIAAAEQDAATAAAKEQAHHLFGTMREVQCTLNLDIFVELFGHVSAKQLMSAFVGGGCNIVDFTAALPESFRAIMARKLGPANRIIDELASVDRAHARSLFDRAFKATGEHLFRKWKQLDYNWVELFSSFSCPDVQAEALMLAVRSSPTTIPYEAAAEAARLAAEQVAAEEEKEAAAALAEQKRLEAEAAAAAAAKLKAEQEAAEAEAAEAARVKADADAEAARLAAERVAAEEEKEAALAEQKRLEAEAAAALASKLREKQQLKRKVEQMEKQLQQQKQKIAEARTLSQAKGGRRGRAKLAEQKRLEEVAAAKSGLEEEEEEEEELELELCEAEQQKQHQHQHAEN
eukprot:COSAG05_NODE_3013_length_2413_cov_169.362106_1_plen_719_part_10